MKGLFVSALLTAALVATAIPAHAGNIAVTGHDDDYHCGGGGGVSAACTQLKDLVNYVKDGSSLPLLTFDAGTELTNDLTYLGIAFTNVNPDTTGAVTASLFNSTEYSAFVVASDTSCNGCDNNPTGEANIAAQSAAIDAFLNAGGGILGLAGGSSSGYYNFVPQVTSSAGTTFRYFSQTPAGAAAGIPAAADVNTHNLFGNPGVGGESSFYQVAEVNTPANRAATLICTGCTVNDGVINGGAVPEPSSIVLLGTGLVGVADLIRRRFTGRI